MFFFSLFSEAFRLLQSGFDFYVHSRLPLRKSRQGIWTEFLQFRYGAYATFERLKIGKATEKLCSNSVAVLECSSKAIPLHRKKHVPTGRAVGEGISIQKENEGVKREICRWQVLKKTAGLHCMAQPGFGHCRTDVTYAVLTVIVTSFCR